MEKHGDKDMKLSENKVKDAVCCFGVLITLGIILSIASCVMCCVRGGGEREVDVYQEDHSQVVVATNDNNNNAMMYGYSNQPQQHPAYGYPQQRHY